MRVREVPRTARRAVVATQGRPGTDSPESSNGHGSGAPRVARTRAESRAQRLSQREDVRRQQKAANWRRRWLPWIIVCAVIVLGIGGVVLYVNLSPTTQPIPGLERYGNLDRGHITGPQNYPITPPVGGTHDPVWVNCGV